MDAWTVLGTVAGLIGKASGSYMHTIGKTAKKKFDKERHTEEEREEYYRRVNQAHEFADMAEGTICGFSETIKAKSKKNEDDYSDYNDYDEYGSDSYDGYDDYDEN